MPQTITNLDAKYALEIVRTICIKVGPGLPGSVQERQRAEIIRKEMEFHLGSENVSLEEFPLAPGAFLGSLPLSGLLLLMAAGLNFVAGHLVTVSVWLTALTSLILSIISILVVVFEFMLYHEFIDPLFMKKLSINVIGTLRSPGKKA